MFGKTLVYSCVCVCLGSLSSDGWEILDYVLAVTKIWALAVLWSCFQFRSVSIELLEWISSAWSELVHASGSADLWL